MPRGEGNRLGLAPPPITAAARAELRVTFDAFDGDGNGYIERSELKVILQVCTKC